MASKEEEGDPYALERPSWMEGNPNPKLLSEEQQKVRMGMGGSGVRVRIGATLLR